MRRRNARGFSLIELLTVIAIVGLLLSITVPSLLRAKQTARALTCRTLLKSSALGLYAYFWEHNQLIDISVSDPVMRPWFTLDEYRTAMGLPLLGQEYKERRSETQEYMPSYDKDFICPSASFALANPEDGLYAMDRSYGLNAHVYYYKDYIRQRLESQSGRIICMADALDWWFNYWNCDRYPDYGEQWLGYETYGMTAYRHGERSNVSFWDGHVEPMTSEQLKANLDEWMKLEERRQQW